MDLFLIIIPVMAIISLIVILMVRSRRAVDTNDSAVNPASLVISANNSEIMIQIEQLPSTITLDSKLYEITDNTVIARISETLPAVAETAAKTITNKQNGY
jgi:hypothetical protein